MNERTDVLKKQTINKNIRKLYCHNMKISGIVRGLQCNANKGLETKKLNSKLQNAVQKYRSFANKNEMNMR